MPFSLFCFLTVTEKCSPVLGTHCQEAASNMLFLYSAILQHLFPPPSLRYPSIIYEQQYHHSAVMMLQQLVDNWIMDLEGGATTTPPVVRVTEFPSPELSDDGFWSSVSRAEQTGGCRGIGRGSRAFFERRLLLFVRRDAWSMSELMLLIDETLAPCLGGWCSTKTRQVFWGRWKADLRRGGGEVAVWWPCCRHLSR